MSAKVYVGNLSWNTTDDTLRTAFSDFGQVVDSIVMRDRDTGKSLVMIKQKTLLAIHTSRIMR
jgi:hypothetical protein